MVHGSRRSKLGSDGVTTAVFSDVEAVADRIRDAARERVPLRIVGAGNWLDAGGPVSATDAVSIRPLDGIVEYVPGDLTLTARGGTTLGDIRRATAAEGQWLALDPHGSEEGTIGATVATASAGPLVTTFGGPRDLVLGVEFVTGGGTVVRGGGRVVKNVAGFDLTRLVTGAWGTLGAITEVTLRLHARPEADESVAIVIAGEDGVERVRRLLRRAPFVPYACEIINAELASALQIGDVAILLTPMAGNRDYGRPQREAFTELGDLADIKARTWTRLRAIEPRGSYAMTFRLSQLPSRLEATWREANALASRAPHTLLHATVARGVVRCIVPLTEGVTEIVRRSFSTPSTVTRGAERLPAELWPLCPARMIDSRLARRVKSTFDPSHVLNPGILGETS
jgi:glycolate oxidase FAD binding subunit